MYEKYINILINENLDLIPFHNKSEGIKRLYAENFPVHLAIHEINKISKNENKYVQSHRHQKPEINIIIPSEEGLKYNIQIGVETYEIDTPTSIWIPEDVPHSANVISGSGYFVCIILQDKYEAK